MVGWKKRKKQKEEKEEGRKEEREGDERKEKQERDLSQGQLPGQIFINSCGEGILFFVQLNFLCSNFFPHKGMKKPK